MDTTPANRQMTYKHEHSLAALELRIQLQSDDFTSAENKSQQYINISAVVIAIVGALSVSQPYLDNCVKFMLLLLAIACTFIFYFSLKSLSPGPWRQFLNTEEERVRFLQWMKTSKDEVYHETVMKTYLRIIDSNDRLIQIKRGYNKKARFAVYLQLGITLFLVIYRLLVG